MMAIVDLWRGPGGKPTSRDGRGKRWRVRLPGHPTRAFETKAEARWWESELIKKGRRGDGGLTVGEVLTLWQKGKAHLPKKSRPGYRVGVVRDRWGSVAVGEVTTHEVQEWISSLTSQHGEELVPAAASTRSKILQVLAGALEIAVATEAIPANPCRGVKVGRITRIDPRFLNVEQLRALSIAAGEHRAMVWLLGTTGIRLGECVALDVSDVDVTRRRLRVRQSKAGRGRDVPITASTLAMLDLDGRKGSLFTAPQGGRIDSDNWRARVWGAAVKAAGVEPLRIHDLRHTAASLAIASGADVKAVQRMLGHASAAMTLDLYGHLWDQGLDEVARRMEILTSVTQE